MTVYFQESQLPYIEEHPLEFIILQVKVKNYLLLSKQHMVDYKRKFLQQSSLYHIQSQTFISNKHTHIHIHTDQNIIINPP